MRIVPMLAGGVLVGVLVGLIIPAAAQRGGNGGPYQLMQHSSTTAVASVFRVDTSSGDVSFCFASGGSGNLSVRCIDASE